MGDLDLKKIVADAESAVAGIKDQELKRPAFEKILERLLAQGKPATGRAAAERGGGSEQPEPEGGAENDTREEFFSAYNHDDPSDNVRLIAAYLYREHGVASFTTKEVKALAEEVGVTVPERIDMTLKQARKDGKNLFSSPSQGRFKATVHGEAYLKSEYKVKKGRKPKSATK